MGNHFGMDEKCSLCTMAGKQKMSARTLERSKAWSTQNDHPQQCQSNLNGYCRDSK